MLWRKIIKGWRPISQQLKARNESQKILLLACKEINISYSWIAEKDEHNSQDLTHKTSRLCFPDLIGLPSHDQDPIWEGIDSWKVGLGCWSGKKKNVDSLDSLKLSMLTEVYHFTHFLQKCYPEPHPLTWRLWEAFALLDSSCLLDG